MQRLGWLVIPAAFVAGFALASLRRPPVAPESFAVQYMTVGVEDWQPGQANFAISMPASAAVTRIQGWASYGPQPGANAVTGASEYIRQTLVSLTFHGSAAPKGVKFTALPSQRYEASVDANLLDLNLKQTGGQTGTIPIDETFPQPVPVPATLIVHYTNETYKVGGTVSAAVQALDTELHFQVFYVVG